MPVIKLVGGPLDSQVKEIGENGPTLIAWGEQYGPLRYVRVNAWTAHGQRIYLHPDHRQSVIEDELIDVAAGWLAREYAARVPRPYADRATVERDCELRAGGELRIYRDKATDPMARLRLVIGVDHPVAVRVDVSPGIILGFIDPATDPRLLYSPRDGLCIEDGVDWFHALLLMFGPLPDGIRPRKPKSRPHPLPLPG